MMWRDNGAKENRISICSNIRNQNQWNCRYLWPPDQSINLPGTKLTNWIIIFFSLFFSIVLHPSHNNKGRAAWRRLQLRFRHGDCQLAPSECQQKRQRNTGTRTRRFHFGEYFFFHSVIIHSIRISNKILKLLLFLFFSSLLAHTLRRLFISRFMYALTITAELSTVSGVCTQAGIQRATCATGFRSTGEPHKQWTIGGVNQIGRSTRI